MKRLREKSRRLLTLLWRESLELRRDRFILTVVLLIPVLQLLLFSYAITTDFDHLPLGVLDRAHTRESRQFVRAIESTGYFVVFPVHDLDAVHAVFSREQARATLVIPADFTETITNGEEVRLGLFLDGSDTTMSTSAEGFLTAIATAFYAHMRLERTPLTERHLRPQPIATVTTERRVLFNPTLSGPIFMIPGLLGLIPMFVTVLATTLVVVRERDAGTLEQLLVTPVSSTEVVLGKILPFMVVGMLAVLLIMGVGWLFFGLTPAGNIALLLAVTPAFLLICLSIGLLVSSIAHSSADAVERSILIMVPQLLLSDAIFPLSLMTWPFRAIGELVPLTHFLRITRGVYLKGQGVADLWGEALILLGFLLFFLVRARQAIKQQMS